MSSKFTNFRTIRKNIIDFIDNNQITTISFDVFDTLLHRRCEPDAVIDGITQWIENYIREKFGFIELDALTARHKAYENLIGHKGKEGLDLDTTIEDMLPIWIDLMLPSISNEDKKKLFELIFQKELEFELSACYANIFMVELIKEIRHKGIKVIFISDMYLGKKIVEILLDKNGYEGLFDAGYVSGDHALLKRTGRLFKYVIDDLKLNPEKTLHIGDNYEADYKMAKKNNLKAFFINDKDLDYKKNTNKFDYLMSKKDSSWKGYAIASFARSTPYEIGSEVMMYGKRNFGPLFASFIHRVIERCKEENVKRIYFLSREGFLLGQIYNSMIDIVPEYKLLGAYYLYVSRLTTFRAALNGKFGLREIRSISDNVGGAISISKLMSPFSIEDSKLSKIASKYGFEDIDLILPHYYLFWTPFINFLNDTQLQEIILEKHLEAKNNLIKLLEQDDFFKADKVAIVDVGWGGQIQENIYQTIKDRDDKPNILGFYMSTNLNAHSRKTPDNWMEWIVSDQSHLEWDGFSTFDFVQSFEAIARAPHATVIDYKEDSGKIIPVLKNEEDLSRQAEVEDDKKVLGLMQKGILEYISYYVQASYIYNAKASETLDYAKSKISVAMRFPSKRDAVHLLSLRNSSDLGLNDIFEMGTTNKVGKFNLKKIKSVLKHSFWKNGAAALLWGYPMQIMTTINSYRKHIAAKNDSLSHGIVWHKYNLDMVTDNISNIKHPYVKIDEKYIIKWNSNINIGEKSSKKVLKRNYDQPYTLKEFLLSQFAYYITNLYLMISGKHLFYYNGISRKKMILRLIAGKIAHNKKFIKLYKKIVK